MENTNKKTNPIDIINKKRFIKKYYIKIYKNIVKLTLNQKIKYFGRVLIFLQLLHYYLKKIMKIIQLII